MVEVRLHGRLAAEFGRVWHLDVHSPAEAARALQVATGRFSKVVSELAQKGMVFRVRTRNFDYDDETVAMSLGSSKRLDFIPVVAGSSAGIRFITGAILATIGFFNLGTGWGEAAMSLGVSLMFGAVTEWLTPKVKREDIKNVESWTLSGPASTEAQGSVVPVIYGEVLTGGIPISAGLVASQVAPDGTTAPAVAIGGKLENAFYPNGQLSGTYDISFSASPFAMDEPYTYTWTRSGFAGVTTTLIDANKATVTLRITVSHAEGAFIDTTGTISVTVTGRSVVNSGGSSPTTVNASKTENVRVHINNLGYNGGA